MTDDRHKANIHIHHPEPPKVEDIESLLKDTEKQLLETFGKRRRRVPIGKITTGDE